MPDLTAKLLVFNTFWHFGSGPEATLAVFLIIGVIAFKPRHLNITDKDGGVLKVVEVFKIGECGRVEEIWAL